MRSDDYTITEADLIAYADGELAEDRRAAIEDHLASHPESAATIAAWRKQNDAIRSLYGPAESEPVPARLDVRRMAIGNGAATVSMTRLAAAVVLCLGLGSAAGWYGRAAFAPPASEGPALVSEAIAAHRLYASEVLHPVEVKADQRTHLATWLSRRLDRPLNIPDLRSSGFTLVGGRLLPAGQRPAAQFMYEDAHGRRVTLYVIPDDEKQETSFRYATEARTEAFYWRDETIACALVGDLPRAELHRLALQSYRQIE